MPTYEYGCHGCGHEFEVFQSIKAEPLSVCPKCHGNQVQRLISGGGGLLFKGSGFYITDYRSSDYQSKAKAEAAPVTKSEDKPNPAKTNDSPSTNTTPAA